jgi:hypothetical protein
MREKRLDITLREPITLDDLRWLVEQCKDSDGDILVSVTGRREYGERDYDPATLNIRADI